MIESDTTLTTLLSPEDYETANKFCKENLMMDLNMAPKIKPAFLLNNIAVVAYIKHIGNYNPHTTTTKAAPLPRIQLLPARIGTPRNNKLK